MSESCSINTVCLIFQLLFISQPIIAISVKRKQLGAVETLALIR